MALAGDPFDQTQWLEKYCRFISHAYLELFVTDFPVVGCKIAANCHPRKRVVVVHRPAAGKLVRAISESD
jgi:hypothetical protein